MPYVQLCLIFTSFQPGSRWKLLPKQSTSVHPPNSIESYLASPIVDADEVKAMGGVMMYWHRKEASCPDLSKFGSDYCSAPGQY